MPLISDNARNSSTCPFCKEFINGNAVRCPHCHADLKPPKADKKAPSFRNGFFAGAFIATIVWISFLVFMYTIVYR